MESEHRPSASAAEYERYGDVITFGEHSIGYDVVPAERKTLGIVVHPSGLVEVRAPVGADPEEIRRRVQRRARWILRNRLRFAELVQQLPEYEYVSGETHRYLGRQYRLKIVRAGHNEAASGGAEGVRLVGRYFEITTRRPDDPDHTRILLERWYRDRARLRLRERFDQACALMRKYGVEVPPMQIRRMERRWGSCTPAGRILLNPRLVLAPTACIDYVIFHELCHLRHPHHGRDFRDLLSRAMPDWPERKARLEKVQ